MRTPSIQVESGQAFQLRFRDTAGRERRLEVAGDGKVETALVDSLRCAEVPSESFVQTLDDPRLTGSDPFTALARSGWQQRYDRWEPDGFVMSLKTPDGDQQEITVSRGLNPIRLRTSADGVEHTLVSQSGKVSESLVLDASPAGVPVYRDEAILLDMPSAFTGGCTV